MIHTDGTYYYAENGTTGNLDYGGPNNIGVTGTNFRDVFNAVLTNTTTAKICIGAGTFPWDDDITIDDRKTVIGSGIDVTTLQRSVAGKTITLQSGVAWTEAIFLQHMTLDGNNLNGTIISVGSGRSVTLADLRIVNSNNTGIHVPAGSWGTRLVRCFIYGNDVGALLEANFVQMINCVARLNDAVNVRVTSAGHSVRLTDCVIEKVQDAAAYNLEIQGGAYESEADHVVKGCYLEDAPAGGGNIKIFNRTAVDIVGVKIEDCYIAEDNVGIWVEEAVDTKIVKNHFNGTGTCVDVQASASYTFISMNELDSTTPYADAGTNTIVMDNTGYNPQAASTPAVGASPVTFGSYVYPVLIEVAGGNVTSITIRTQASTLTAGTWMLYPGDTCVIVYVVAPTVTLWPQ